MAATAKNENIVTDVTRNTKAIIDAQPKVRVKIPLLPNNEKSDNMIRICINGYVMWFERGKSIEVPESVAEVLERGGVI